MIKLTATLISSALLLAVSSQAFAAHHENDEAGTGMAKATCENPSSTPLIPDGNVASLDELIAAQNSVKAYQAELIEYRECIGAGMVADPVEQADIQKNAALNAAHDASVDAETKVVEEFSAARLAYQARQPAKK